MGFDIKDQQILGAISSEAAARKAAIAALQDQINGLGTNVAAYSAQVAQVATFIDGGVSFNASALVGRIGLTQIQPGFALASDLLTLQAEVDGNNSDNVASINTLSEVVATETSALAQVTTTLTATVTNNNVQTNASIVQQAIVSSSAVAAVAATVTTLTATVASNLATTTASITSEATTRATADTALSTTITTLTATVGTKTSVFSQSATPTANAVGDVWINTSTGATEYWNGTAWTNTFIASAAITAAVSTESTARASADSALSSSITTLTATVGTKNTVFSQSGTPTANATGDEWINTTTGAISYWNGSSWVNTFVASAAISAAVAVEASARATQTGNLSANYSVTVTAGNIVTGMQLNSSSGGGATSSVIAFEAATFQISDGSSNYPVFTVSGGIVTASNELSVGSGFNATTIRAGGISMCAGYLTIVGNGTAQTMTFGTSSNGISINTLLGSSGAINFNSGGVMLGQIGNNGAASLASVECVGVFKLHGWVSGGGYTPIGGATVTGYFIATDQSGTVHRILTV